MIRPGRRVAYLPKLVLSAGTKYPNSVSLAVPRESVAPATVKPQEIKEPGLSTTLTLAVPEFVV